MDLSLRFIEINRWTTNLKCIAATKYNKAIGECVIQISPNQIAKKKNEQRQFVQPKCHTL